MTRVLLVEDHRLVAQALEMGLQGEGFELFTPAEFLKKRSGKKR